MMMFMCVSYNHDYDDVHVVVHDEVHGDAYNRVHDGAHDFVLRLRL